MLKCCLKSLNPKCKTDLKGMRHNKKDKKVLLHLCKDIKTYNWSGASTHLKVWMNIDRPGIIKGNPEIPGPEWWNINLRDQQAIVERHWLRTQALQTIRDSERVTGCHNQGLGWQFSAQSFTLFMQHPSRHAYTLSKF